MLTQKVNAIAYPCCFLTESFTVCQCNIPVSHQASRLQRTDTLRPLAQVPLLSF